MGEIKNGNINAVEVACCLIQKLHHLDITDVTQMKINKLTYFSLVWFGVLYNDKLFNENPKAYRNGPVFKSLREEWGMCSDNPISSQNLRYDCRDFDDNISAFLDRIINKYGKMSAWELADESHDNVWISAKNSTSNEMSWENIVNFYQQNLKKATNIDNPIYDSENDVLIIKSDIIQGLILEYSNNDRVKLEQEVQDISHDLISLNYATN